MTQISFEHQIAYITARITVKTPNASSIGTGFFYYVPLNNGTDRSIVLLISNKHVFLDPKGRLTISLNREKEDSTPDYGNIRTFDQVGFEDAYFTHPDSEVNLACINASAITRTDVFYRYLNEGVLTAIDYEKVAPGSEVIFVGYPQGLYDPINYLPIIRSGVIASVPNVDFNGKGQIVIDAQIFPGSSGSPVFVSWDGRYSLLGVVSDTMTRDSELQILQASNPQLGVKEMLGLGIVVKQRHVRELIDYAVNEHVQRTSQGT